MVNAAIVCFYSAYTAVFRRTAAIVWFDCERLQSFVAMRVVWLARSGPVFLFYFNCIEFKENISQAHHAASDS